VARNWTSRTAASRIATGRVVWPRPTEVFGEQGRVRGHWHDQGGVDYPGRPTNKTQSPGSAAASAAIRNRLVRMRNDRYRAAMPVVNAKARAKTKAIFFMTRAPLNYALICRRWVKASVTAVTFWGFSYCRPGRREAAIGFMIAPLLRSLCDSEVVARVVQYVAWLNQSNVFVGILRA
jgi:hypothetical protein